MYVGDDESEADPCSDLAEMPPILGMRQFPVPASHHCTIRLDHAFDQRKYTLSAYITRTFDSSAEYKLHEFVKVMCSFI